MIEDRQFAKDGEYRNNMILLVNSPKGHDNHMTIIPRADCRSIMTDIADEDGELYEDEDGHSLVSLEWLIDTYEDRLCQLVNYEKLSFKTDGQGEISIIIERKLE